MRKKLNARRSTPNAEWLHSDFEIGRWTLGVGRFPLAIAFALELQVFSVLPFQQTTDLVEKLRAQNVASEELIIPDEIHDLLRWSDSVISKQ